MKEYTWSQWYNLYSSSVNAPVPDMPGIYEIRTDYEFGRLRGTSRIVYIGSAAKGNNASLRKRLIEQRIKDSKRYLSRTEKFLKEAGHTVEFHFLTTRDGTTAKRIEAKRLTEYEKEHWELPPGNGVLPTLRSEVSG